MERPDTSRITATLAWTCLALGLVAIVLYGLHLETGWPDADDPSTADAEIVGDFVPDPELRPVWGLLGGNRLRFAFDDLTDDPIRLERARALLDAKLADDPQHAEALLLDGLHRVATGDIDGAVDSLERGLDAAPDATATRLGLGILLHQKGDLDGAIRVTRTATELDPTSVAAWNNLGQLLWIAGEKEESAVAHRRSLALKDGRTN